MGLGTAISTAITSREWQGVCRTANGTVYEHIGELTGSECRKMRCFFCKLRQISLQIATEILVIFVKGQRFWGCAVGHRLCEVFEATVSNGGLHLLDLRV